MENQDTCTFMLKPDPEYSSGSSRPKYTWETWLVWGALSRQARWAGGQVPGRGCGSCGQICGCWWPGLAALVMEYKTSRRRRLRTQAAANWYLRSTD